jgi:glycosyltransferase involved in cell wall biosynthesis
VKIVHLLGWYFPDSVGGTEIYVEALCRHLRDAGHEVLVAAPIVSETPHASYVHDGVTVFRYAIPRQLTREEAVHQAPVRGADAFHRWLADQQPDLLHVHSFASGVGLAEIRAARRIGSRVIATCHLPGLAYMCRTGELMQWGTMACDGLVETTKCAACTLVRLGTPTPVARALSAIPVAASSALGRVSGAVGTALGMRGSIAAYTAMQEELFDLVDAFVVLNDTARNMLISNGSPASKLVVNRLGLSDPPVMKPGPDLRATRKPVRFGYVGRLHRTKGLVELLRAVRQTPPAIIFDLEVRGPVLDEGTRAFVAELQAIAAGDARIRFEPGVPHAQVPQVLASLDALVCPSTWFENGPTVALEANAVGTPVIGSRIGNLTEIIVDGVNGRLVGAGDIDGWAHALADVAQSPEQTIDCWRRRIGTPRTMDDIAREYLSLYAA